MISVVMILAAAGLILSIYGWFIEFKIDHDVDYKPLCDINDKASCSKAVKSKYSRTFGISNVYLGLVFYSAIMVLSYLRYHELVFWGALAAAGFSLYFAYRLFFDVKTYCPVCLAVYIVNGSLLIASYYRW